MKFPSKNEVENLRAQYPIGTRLELIAMEDPYATLKAGDCCTVRGVDDAGQIMCSWDTGSMLSLIPNVDSFKEVPHLSEKSVEGLLAVRDTARTNMFDLNAVAVIANELGYYDTVIACTEQKKLVSNFILTGKTEI